MTAVDRLFVFYSSEYRTFMQVNDGTVDETQYLGARFTAIYSQDVSELPEAFVGRVVTHLRFICKNRPVLCHAVNYDHEIPESLTLTLIMKEGAAPCRSGIVDFRIRSTNRNAERKRTTEETAQDILNAALARERTDHMLESPNADSSEELSSEHLDSLSRFEEALGQFVGPPRASALAIELSILWENQRTHEVFTTFRKHLAMETGYEAANELLGLPVMVGAPEGANEWEAFFLGQIGRTRRLDEETTALLLFPMRAMTEQVDRLALLTVATGIDLDSIREECKRALYAAYDAFTESGRNQQAAEVWRSNCRNLLNEAHERGSSGRNQLGYLVSLWSQEADAKRTGGCMSACLICLSLGSAISALFMF